MANVQEVISKRNRNTTLDIFKLFSAYMVVFIHVPFYGEMGGIVQSIARFAVPVFFISSGFFVYNNNCEKIKKKIKNIFLMYVFTTVLYHLFGIVSSFITGASVGEIIADYMELLRMKSMIEFFIFNVSLSSEHLWFLLALLYCYVIQYFVCKFKIPEKVTFLFAIICLIANLILSEGMALFNIEISAIVTRNFLFVGYPFVVIGLWLRKNTDKIVKTNQKGLIIVFLLGLAETILSRICLGKEELYIGSILMAITLMILAIKNPQIIKSEKIVNLSRLHQNIYLFHVVVYKTARVILPMFGISFTSKVLGFVYPILICIATTILAYIIDKVQAKILVRNSAT